MSQLLPIVGPDSPEATTSIITIQKARLKDQHLTCEFTEQRSEDAPARAFALTCYEQVHSDLTHRLSRLVPHLCLLTEQLTLTTTLLKCGQKSIVRSCRVLTHS